MKFSDSLKKNKDFQTVYRGGNSKANKFIVMYIKKNHMNINRLGISASKKVGNSVIRHHLARLIREAYRLHEEDFHIGWDLVVVVRQSASDISFHDTERSLLKLANLQKIMNV